MADNVPHPTPLEMEEALLGKRHPNYYKKRTMAAAKPAASYTTRAVQAKTIGEDEETPLKPVDPVVEVATSDREVEEVAKKADAEAEHHPKSWHSRTGKKG